MKIWPLINGRLANPPLIDERMSRAFWPSDASFTFELDNRKVHLGGCRRKQFYRFNQFPPDQRGSDFSTQWVLNAGHFFENLLGDEFKKAGVFLGAEVTADIVRTMPDGGQYRISGRMDFLILNPTTGQVELVECKSTAGYMAAGLVTPSKEKGFAPKPEHVLQCIPYLVWLGLPNQGQKDPRANLLYLTRDGDVGEHEIYLDKTDGHIVIENSAGVHHWKHMTVQSVFESWDYLYACIRDNKVPDRDYELLWSRETILWKLAHGELNKTDTKQVEDRVKSGFAGQLLDKGDWNCGYCEYSKGCWAPYPGFAPKPMNEVTTNYLPTAYLAPAVATGVHVGNLPS